MLGSQALGEKDEFYEIGVALESGPCISTDCLRQRHDVRKADLMFILARFFPLDPVLARTPTMPILAWFLPHEIPLGHLPRGRKIGESEKSWNLGIACKAL